MGEVSGVMRWKNGVFNGALPENFLPLFLQIRIRPPYLDR